MPRSTDPPSPTARTVSPAVSKRLAAQASRSARRRRGQIIAIAGVLLIVAVVGSAIVSLQRSAPSALPPVSDDSVELIRDDTLYLSRAEAPEATVVEFIDFECSACAVAHPETERLREAYGDRVDFALRHLPLPQHGNAISSALAVQAAVQQGAMVAMIDLLFERQAEWRDAAPDSQSDRFRGYAEELGLDLVAYDRSVADPATLERISRDAADAAGLGVRGTPTFFLDGEQVALSSFAELETLIVAALAD